MLRNLLSTLVDKWQGEVKGERGRAEVIKVIQTGTAAVEGKVRYLSSISFHLLPSSPCIPYIQVESQHDGCLLDGTVNQLAATRYLPTYLHNIGSSGGSIRHRYMHRGIDYSTYICTLVCLSAASSPSLHLTFDISSHHLHWSTTNGYQRPRPARHLH